MSTADALWGLRPSNGISAVSVWLQETGWSIGSRSGTTIPSPAPRKELPRRYILSVRDDRAQAAKEGEEAQQIADALLDLLADQLEDLKDKEGLVKGMEEILKQVDRNLDRMRERLDRFELEALKRNLLSLKNRVLDEPKETVTQELETARPSRRGYCKAGKDE